MAQLSLSKYNIPLNAVVHDSYDTMYAYLRRPTARKPLTELDAEPYLSALHPRGEALVQLLESGLKYAAIRGAKRKKRRSAEVSLCSKTSRRTIFALLENCACMRPAKPSQGDITLQTSALARATNWRR